MLQSKLSELTVSSIGTNSLRTKLLAFNKEQISINLSFDIFWLVYLRIMPKNSQSFIPCDLTSEAIEACEDFLELTAGEVAGFLERDSLLASLHTATNLFSPLLLLI